MSNDFQTHQTALTLDKSDRRAQRVAYDVSRLAAECGNVLWATRHRREKVLVGAQGGGVADCPRAKKHEWRCEEG